MGELPANIRIGPSPDRLGVRVVPGSGDVPTRLLFDGQRSFARFKLSHELAGTTYDAVVKGSVSRMDEELARPWTLGGENVQRYLASAGLDVRIDAAAVMRLEEEARRARARFTRWLPEGDSWRLVPGTIDPADKERAARTLEALGWREHLFPFAFDSVCEAATKRDALLAFFMGAGKTRASVALAECWRNEDAPGPVIVIALRRHLISWAEELPILAPIRERYGGDAASWWVEKNDRPNFNKPFLLISFERLTRLDEPTLARLAEVARNSVVILEEAYSIQNHQSNRFAAIRRIQGKHHVALTGTPIRGWPDRILPILDFTVRGGSVAFPDYSLARQGAERRFQAEHVMFATADDGSRRKVPILKNPERFYSMLEPIMARRRRGEPEVVAQLGAADVIRQVVPVELDLEHLAHYEACLERFSSWYKRVLEARGTPHAFPANELMVKLGVLIRAVVQPWEMDKPETEPGDDFRFPYYPRQLTSLHRWAIDRALGEVAAGYQVLIFGRHTSSLDLIAEHLGEVGVTTVHGRVPQKQRPDNLALFRSGRAPVMVASLGVAAESLNLGQAGVAILLEASWDPSSSAQAEARMTRGAVLDSPRSYRLTSPGTILDYVHAFAAMKQGAMDAGLDSVRQTIRGEDVPDIQSYSYSLVVEGNPKLLPPRRYQLEEAV